MSAVPPVASRLLRLLAHSEAIRAIRMGKRGSSLAVQLLCMGIWLWCGVMAAPGDEKKGGYGAADEKKGGGYGATGKAGGKDGYPKDKKDSGKKYVNLFMMNWELDPRIIGGFLIGILCGTMLLEWVVHYFESRAEEATKRMLDKVYKELALLGCISFLLFLIQTLGTKLDKTMYLAFEYAHLLIFFLALVYVIQAAILIYAVLPMQKRLEKMNSAASADDTTRNYRAQLGFRVFRAKFIDMHNLPKTFLFDLYQIQSYKSHVTSSLEVTPYCWMAVIIIFIVHVLVSTYAKPVSKILTSNAAFLIYGWMILAVDLFCYSIVAAMHRRVLLRATASLKAKRREQKQMANLGCSSPNSTGSGRRQAMHLSRMSSLIKDKRHEFESAHHRVIALRKSHHHDHTIDVETEQLRSLGGFSPFQDSLFKAAQDLLLVAHCLYLAAFIITYIGKNVKESGSPGLMWFMNIITPLPILFAMIFIGPAIIQRYLLVNSLGRVNTEALEDVEHYMSYVEEAFEEIAKSMEDQGETTKDLDAIYREFDDKDQGVITYAQLRLGMAKHWHLRFSHEEFRALTRFLDTDGSGFIDKEEFKRITLGEEVFEEGDQSFSSFYNFGDDSKIEISVDNLEVGRVQ